MTVGMIDFVGSRARVACTGGGCAIHEQDTFCRGGVTGNSKREDMSSAAGLLGCGGGLGVVRAGDGRAAGSVDDCRERRRGDVDSSVTDGAHEGDQCDGGRVMSTFQVATAGCASPLPVAAALRPVHHFHHHLLRPSLRSTSRPLQSRVARGLCRCSRRCFHLSPSFNVSSPPFQSSDLSTNRVAQDLHHTSTCSSRRPQSPHCRTPTTTGRSSRCRTWYSPDPPQGQRGSGPKCPPR